MVVSGTKVAPCLAWLVVALGACSSSSSPPAQVGPDNDSGGPAEEAAGATVTEHGVVLDYGTYLSSGKLVPVVGLTVTDAAQTTTTDSTGSWSLTLPATAMLGGTVGGTSQGDAYTTLNMPQVMVAAGGTLDRGNIITPDTSTFSLEHLTLNTDQTLAVVHLVVYTASTCPSIAGGTVAVTSPPNAKVAYFLATGYPSTTQTSFVAQTGGLPAADIYDVTPGATITFQITHPTCTQMAYPMAWEGGTFTGQVTTQASEPGDNNSALVAVLQ
jgi:hypothetical protein